LSGHHVHDELSKAAARAAASTGVTSLAYTTPASTASASAKRLELKNILRNVEGECASRCELA
jgi:hypothetical protein